MPVGAAIGGSAVIGAGASLYASSKASDAAQNSLNFQQQVYQNNQTNLKPFVSNGTNATYSLASLYGLPTPDNPSGGGAAGVNAAYQAFTQLPAYQFPFQQGNLALERQLNAQGKTQSGAQARETQQFGQGLASQYLMSNYVNPLLQMSQQGSNAAAGLASSGVASGQQVGQSYGNLGAAQGAGAMGVGTALGAGGSNLALYSALSNGGSSYGGSPGSSIGGATGPTSYGGSGGPAPLVGSGSYGGLGNFNLASTGSLY